VVKDGDNMPGTWRKVETPEHGRIYFLRIDVPNPADQIHVRVKDDESRGYGGARLTFKLEHGGAYATKGPWLTNAEQAEQHTGVCVDHLHLTKVALYVGQRCVYYEERPVLGELKRGQVIAHQLSDVTRETYRVHTITATGENTTFIGPNTPTPVKTRLVIA
jgi:hypothetical protein